MQLYIIRHAQSYNNALPDIRDRVRDPHLTDLGHRQAEAVADYLVAGVHPEQKFGTDAEATGVRTVQGFGITRLYCSAMYRALQTASYIGRALALNPEVWLDIHESGGIFLEHDDERGVVGYPGKTRREIREEFPGYLLPNGVTDEGWWDVSQGREDWFSCQGRAIRVAHQLRAWAV
jgi:2,3-bisphosphoglycerate-dependent phosphoglycerate mutase